MTTYAYEEVRPGVDDYGLGTPEQPSNELEEKFWAFHQSNPHVYELFERFTHETIRKGYTRFSVASIIERIRWETMVVTSDHDFKINNNHRAYYARLWMRNNPKYVNFFELRATT